MKDYYYWMDPSFNYGDFRIAKFAIHRMEIIDGKKERDTDKIILWSAYEDVPEFIPESGDVSSETLAWNWEVIDRYIEQELGFLPDYEVG